ncbi:hypothetical protein BU15DRAFT_67658 [Melanogaster broomeanus]|nr:hypothetical protein BU15DRAFT_67658 [Melanogaster broomeanus]
MPVTNQPKINQRCQYYRCAEGGRLGVGTYHTAFSWFPNTDCLVFLQDSNLSHSGVAKGIYASYGALLHKGTVETPWQELGSVLPLMFTACPVQQNRMVWTRNGPKISTGQPPRRGLRRGWEKDITPPSPTGIWVTRPSTPGEIHIMSAPSASPPSGEQSDAATDESQRPVVLYQVSTKRSLGRRRGRRARAINVDCLWIDEDELASGTINVHECQCGRSTSPCGMWVIGTNVFIASHIRKWHTNSREDRNATKCQWDSCVRDSISRHIVSVHLGKVLFCNAWFCNECGEGYFPKYIAEDGLGTISDPEYLTWAASKKLHLRLIWRAFK